MRRRPWALVILAGLHFLAPIGNIILNAVIQKTNVMEYFVFAMSPGYLMRNWVIIVAPVVAGIAIYACQRWSFFVYFLAISGLFYFSYTGYLAKAGSIVSIRPTERLRKFSSLSDFGLLSQYFGGDLLLNSSGSKYLLQSKDAMVGDTRSIQNQL